jgi:carbamoyl-phosphate synthase large subunit
MHSVGEAMAIGRSFKEALQKAIRSLEIGVAGLDDPDEALEGEALKHALVTPSPDRIFHVKAALAGGMSVDEVYALTGIDPWFLDNVAQLAEAEADLRRRGAEAKRLEDALSAEELLTVKQMGFSDRQLVRLLGAADEDQVRTWRLACGIRPVYKLVDTCAAEFEAFTPYYYSTYEQTPVQIA